MRDTTLQDLDAWKGEVDSSNYVITAAASHTIPKCICEPRGLNAAEPGAIFYHGEGWVLGNVNADDVFWQIIAKDLGRVVCEHGLPTSIRASISCAG
jgi:acetyl esterase/lipase